MRYLPLVYCVFLHSFFVLISLLLKLLFMKSIVSLLFVCISCSFFAQMPKIKFDEYKLKNGLTVILHEDLRKLDDLVEPQLLPRNCE